MSLPRWVFPFVLGNTLTALLLALSVQFLAPRLRPVAGDQPTQARTFRTGKTPPWGELEAVEFPLADASQLDLANDQHMLPPRWFFGGATKLQLIRFLMTCDLSSRERRYLLDRTNWKVTSGGIEISPPESIVYALSSYSREKIYSVLASNPKNIPQTKPLRLPIWGMEEHLIERGFTPIEVARLRQLSYTNANRLCLADLGITKKVLGDPAFDDLLEYFYATPAYQLRLHISKDSDADELAAYWGKGGREDRIRPLLKSLARVPGGSAINISYLLPTFARLRLYTFPEAWNEPNRIAEDCAFTALNFFAETADTNYLTRAGVEHAMKTEFVPVNEDPTFGDLIGLVDANRHVFHMSIYIADNFVFTKNGVGSSEPWVLMRMQDMLTLYFGPQQAGQMVILRRREFQPDKPAKVSPAPRSPFDYFTGLDV